MPLWPDRTMRFEAFVAPARLRLGPWRPATVLAAAGAGWIGTTMLLLPLAIDRRTELLLYLASFAGMVAALAIALRLVEGRGLASLLGPGGLRPGAIVLGTLAVAVLSLASPLAMLPAARPVQQMPLGEWARWLPLALAAVVVQSAAEELVFRGYLLQALAARFRARWVWWGLPAVLFGALHWNPAGHGAGALLVLAGTAAMGLILADLTVRTGNLSLAIGVHAANNAFALLVLALPSGLDGLALWVLDVPGGAKPGALVVVDLATTLLAYGAWLVVWRWRGDARAGARHG